MEERKEEKRENILWEMEVEQDKKNFFYFSVHFFKYTVLVSTNYDYTMHMYNVYCIMYIVQTNKKRNIRKAGTEKE